ncbi:hypothetical protein [Desulfonatronum lacustre]|uniref:hypothetical protein n=1 Tax=Desulfonatronum lacustre TaxID=66849 RepID=UPI00055203D8|nr:hypothetical protein [Desulfonatronum lacustre]
MEDTILDVKEALHIIAEQLPDDASWNDALDRIRFRMAIAEGKRAAISGEFATDEEVRRVFAKYGVEC